MATIDSPYAVADAEVGAILQTSESKLLAMVSRLAEERDLWFDSLLDVGCGTRPLDQWFASYRRAEVPRRFVGIDSDPAVLASLAERGTPVFRNFSAPFDLRSDLVVAADVLEYLTPSAGAGLLRSCATNTVKMFALSTTNAAYWRKGGVNPELPWLRWMPDAVVRCYREGDDPSRIRNAVEASRVAAMMREAFDPGAWETLVFEAWPWEIKDMANDQSATLYLRTFAVAIARRNADV